MYYPILRAKQGELAALCELSTEVKKNISPILQIIPDTNYKRKVPKSYWTTLSNRINKLVGFNKVLLDNFYLADDLDNFIQLINSINNNIKIGVVVHPNSLDDYLNYVKSEFNNEAFIRFKNEYATPRLINYMVDYVKNELEIDEKDIEIIIDYGSIEFNQIEVLTNSFNTIINSRDLSQMGKIVLASGCFPKDVSEIDIDTVKRITRIELILFDRCKQIFKSLAFADYANVNPDFNPFAQAFLGSCTLKYTDDNSYVIFRGAKPDFHPDGNRQYIYKCMELVEKDFYCGRDFSVGDKYIYECSQDTNGPGNAGTWVKVTQNHHFTKVVAQLNAD